MSTVSPQFRVIMTRDQEGVLVTLNEPMQKLLAATLRAAAKDGDDPLMALASELESPTFRQGAGGLIQIPKVKPAKKGG